VPARPAWITENDALAYLERVLGDRDTARREYLQAARAGDIPTRGRRDLLARFRELIPREDYWRAFWADPRFQGVPDRQASIPDPLASGLHFGPGGPRWYDREVRHADVEKFWPQPPHLTRMARREAIIATMVANGVRLETDPRGWAGIADKVRAAAGISIDPVTKKLPFGWGDKQIERDFKKALRTKKTS
jgi:hypothetical protein